MSYKEYSGFTVTYLTPISNQSGDEIYFEKYAFKYNRSESGVDSIVGDLRVAGSVLLSTTEGLLYLNGHNIASLMFHEEDVR